MLSHHNRRNLPFPDKQHIYQSACVTSRWDPKTQQSQTFLHDFSLKTEGNVTLHTCGLQWRLAWNAARLGTSSSYLSHLLALARMCSSMICFDICRYNELIDMWVEFVSRCESCDGCLNVLLMRVGEICWRQHFQSILVAWHFSATHWCRQTKVTQLF